MIFRTAITIDEFDQQHGPEWSVHESTLHDDFHSLRSTQAEWSYAGATT